MSLFGKVIGGIGKVAGGFLLGGIPGAALGAASAIGGAVRGGARAAGRVIPSAGRVPVAAGAGAAAGAIGTRVASRPAQGLEVEMKETVDGQVVACPKKRRRRRGFTPRDISQSRRIMRMLKDFQKLAPRSTGARPSRTRVLNVGN